jgi:hypothetical protein
MSAFMFINSPWLTGTRWETGVGRRPTRSADDADSNAGVAPDEGALRPRPSDADRPILRRSRRYRSDGVLGLRWLA